MSFLRSGTRDASSRRQVVRAELSPTDNIGSRRSLNSLVKRERPTERPSKLRQTKTAASGGGGRFLADEGS